MSGNLLITTENGRGMKTYGVAGLHTSNMKIVFLCIIAGVTCSARETEGTGAYPGVGFGLPLADQKPLEDSIEDPQPYNYLVPLLKQDTSWRSDSTSPTNQDRRFSRISEKISESLRDILELIKQRRRRFPFNYPKYDNDEERREYYDEEIRRRTPQYPYRISHQRILDDYQPDDFTFHDEQDTQSNQDQQQQTTEEELSDYQNVVPVKALGKELEQEIDLPKPAEFAYSPFDPRYYDNISITGRKSTVVPSVKKPKEISKTISLTDNKQPIVVEQRNEDNNYNQQNKAEQSQAADDSVQVVAVQPNSPEGDAAGVLIIAFVAGISAAATVGLIAFGIGWYNLQKHVKNASDVEYPAYGITGPNKDVSPSGDRRLAQSAQMYHYQHQKQQIIAMESRSAAGDRHGSVSEADSDEENEEGDYTVYECPGLAPTGEMEVKNPLFQDDPTPAQTPATKTGNGGENQKK